MNTIVFQHIVKRTEFQFIIMIIVKKRKKLWIIDFIIIVNNIDDGWIYLISMTRIYLNFIKNLDNMIQIYLPFKVENNNNNNKNKEIIKIRK